MQLENLICPKCGEDMTWQDIEPDALLAADSELVIARCEYCHHEVSLEPAGTIQCFPADPSGVDTCPNCGSRNTERTDLIGHEPDTWHVECNACGEAFGVQITE